ncbi:MAG: LytTR family DNA-binding domain-containing protein [Flavobacteriales bacterium]|nr:LytTR family DNA-binding domain-containing protein [Flavobacteriales bacterium]
MKLRSIVVDDEYYCRNNLKMIIDDFCPEIEVIGMADSADQAREMISKHQPDLVFLDIKMPKEDGFSLLESMPTRNFSVVFTTAHSEYALKAFKADAVDYIEKPINIDDLRNAVNKVLKFQVNQQLEKPIETPMKAEKENDRISLATRDGFMMVKNDEIIHLEASDNYTMIYMTDNRKFLSCKNIKVYEESLNKNSFFRVHKSHIINVANHLKGFTRSEGNIAILSNGKHIPVARRKLTDFLERINTI